MSDTTHKPVPPTRLRTYFSMDYPVGLFNGRFAREMRDNGRLIGIVCRHCGFSMLPPQAVCTVCHGENIKDPNWVEMGPEATVAGFMTFNMPFIDTNDLSVQKGHYTVGQLMVDSPGRTSGFLWHFIGEADASQLRNGMRVRAIYRPRNERKGLMTDILNWVPTGE
ncbi:Zn-ribbon domain-containing OB-fold protein [Variovorax sp. LARHSF232]